MDTAVDRPKLLVQELTVGYGEAAVQHNLSFAVKPGSIFAIMGPSGCGKSTVLKSLIGLRRPSAGTIQVNGEDYWAAGELRRAELDQRFGMLFQNDALWSAMSIAENVALPLRMFTQLDNASIDALVRLKLALVGLPRAGERMPAELSGGMRKRAALARALSLDPEILFFDEPSAGLDPVNAARLDDLILELRDGFNATVVLVSHELSSLFAICDDGVFLDAETKTAIAHGSPKALRDNCDHPSVRSFMHRDGSFGSGNNKGGQNGGR
jgi:phospholipid/cholesterol/gamma-HCH transport system ATP-binding protein